MSRRSLLALSAALLALAAAGQTITIRVDPAPNLVVPQSRTYYVTAWPPPHVSSARPLPPPVAVEIVEQAATTTMDLALSNPSDRRQEAQLLVPVPEGAVVRGFTFQGAAAEARAEILPKDEARRIYDSIVAQTRDPALLEFVGLNLVRSSVFPVEARGTQQVRLVYEHLLEADGKRVDYHLPRSDALEYRVPWEVAVSVKAKQPIATVYSPSHAIKLERVTPNEYRATLGKEAAAEPGPFRLSYLTEGEGVAAALFAYPDPKIGGGYFLLLASVPPPPKPGPDAKPQRKEVTVVLDRSGSMHGEKIKQVREAAKQVVAGLDQGDTFNLFVYNEYVDRFAAAPVAKTADSEKAARDYLDSMQPQGGTNINDALVEALRQPPTPDALALVLFLTDGLPTIGQTSEKLIRETAKVGNPHHRRVFTFGVGNDVNVPLLEALANESRASSVFVLPKEDVEVKVGQMFRRLAGPVLASPTLRVTDEHGEPTPGRVRSVLPAELGDVFDGDQAVILGQYLGEQPLHFRLTGDYRGKPRTFAFTFALDKATTRNGFVARQWAVRQIDLLIYAIRQLGADFETPAARARLAADPRFKELVDEIVRLSQEFGVLTEYTAFLAREGTDLARRDANLGTALRNFEERAVMVRSGAAAVSQSYNYMDNQWQNALGADQHAQSARNQSRLSYNNNKNGYFDANLQRVEVTTVQQRNGQAFYKKGNRWVQSSLAGGDAKPDQEIAIGSPEYQALTERLARDHRQGSLAQEGEVLLDVDGKKVLVR